MLSGINVGLGLINISSGLSLICYRITEADSSGTRDYSTDFLLSRYLKLFPVRFVGCCGRSAPCVQLVFLVEIEVKLIAAPVTFGEIFPRD